MTEQDNNQPETLMEFPCAFALKVMVLDSAGVNNDMLALINQYVKEEVTAANVSERPSRTGKYKALTVTFTATSKQQLDNIYMALNKHDKVRMAL